MTNPAFVQPNEYDFGEDFNYNRWNPNTKITLTNVPWNNDYRDVVRFPDRVAINAYIDSVPGNFNATGLYARVNFPIDLDIPFNVGQRFNYIRAVNPAQPTDSGDFQREFYYFILDVEYRSPNSTRFVLQLDVWTSFIHDIQLGRAYVQRGHIGVANKDHFRNNGRDYLSIPEGLDVGGEYVVVHQERKNITTNSPWNGGQPQSGNGYNVLVCSTVDLDAGPGTIERPSLMTAKGSGLQDLPSGASFYIFPSASSFKAFISSYSDKPWVTQGIVSVTAIPAIHRYYPNRPQTVSRIGAYTDPFNGPGEAIRHDMLTDWRYRDDLIGYHIPEKYRHFRKFWTYPYMVIELTTNTGNPIILKPESWNSPHASVRETAALVPPGQRISFLPMSYNSNTEPGRVNTPMEPGDGWDMQTLIANFPTFAVVNNSAIAYLAQNARSIAYQFDSADWSQSKALRGNQVGYDQATAGISASTAMMENGIGASAASLARSNQLATDTTMLNGVWGIGTGLVGGAVGGAAIGPAGAVTGALAGGIGGAASMIKNTMINDMNINASMDQQAIANRAARSGNAIQSATAGYMRDTNKGLADWAAKGDYENQIAGMNAKLQDAKMMQPSTVGQAGGETFNHIHGLTGITVKWKIIDQAAIAVIGDYWSRFGYAVQRQMNIPQDLAVMSKFSYWKMLETYIRASRVPEAMKQVIRGILEKGVTVYRNPDDIGFVDPATNEILPGFSIDGYVPEPPAPLPEPEPEKKKKRKSKMLVYTWTDAVDRYALAGSSPGTQANWIETDSAQKAMQWYDATGQTTAVRLTATEAATLKTLYLGALQVETVENGEVA